MWKSCSRGLFNLSHAARLRSGHGCRTRARSPAPVHSPCVCLIPAGPRPEAGAGGAPRPPGREACERRALGAGEASGEDGSRCWVSVGRAEVSGHLEPVLLGGVIYATLAPTAACLIAAAPRGSRYQPWLARPGRARGAAGGRGAEPGGEGRSSAWPPGGQSSAAERTRSRRRQCPRSHPGPGLAGRESQTPRSFSEPPLPYL